MAYDPYQTDIVLNNKNRRVIFAEAENLDPETLFEWKTFHEKVFDNARYVPNFPEWRNKSKSTLNLESGEIYFTPAGTYTYAFGTRTFTFKFNTCIRPCKSMLLDKPVFHFENIQAQALSTEIHLWPQNVALNILDSEDFGTREFLELGADRIPVEDGDEIVAQSSSDQCGRDILFRKAFNNLGYMRIGSHGVNVTFLGPQRLITVGHAFYSDGALLPDGTDVTLYLRNHEYHFKFYQSELQEWVTKDLAIMHVPNIVPNCPNMIKYFIKESDDVDRRLKSVAMPVYRRLWNETPVLMSGFTKDVAWDTEESTYCRFGRNFPESVTKIHGHKYGLQTENGDCGSPLVLLDKNFDRKILGIHVAGDDKGCGRSAVLTQESLMTMNDLLDKRHPRYQITPLPLHSVVAKGLMDLPPRVPAARNMVPTVGIKAQSDVPRLQFETSIKPCLRDDDGKSLTGFESVRKPSIMKVSDIRNGVDFNPTRKNPMENVSKYDCPIYNVPLDDLYVIRDYMIEKYKNTFNRHKGFGVTSFDVAVNGDERDYYDTINMKTSAGYPFCLDPSKHDGKKFLFNINDDGYKPIYDMKDTLLDAVALKWSCLTQGIHSESFTYECMKDELLKPKKIDSVATRLFSILGTDGIICSRKLTLDFCVQIMENREHLGPQVGINMDSIEADLFYQKHASFSNIAFCCDYSAFDSTQHPCFLDNSADIISGCDDTDAPPPDNLSWDQIKLARRTLFQEMYQRMSICGRKVKMIQNGLASGVSVTAIVNSIVNEQYLRYSWIALARIHEPEMVSQEDFDENVLGSYYGDDNVISIKEKVKEWFNLRTIANFLKTFGINMTDAKKNPLEMTEPYEPVSQIQFLKRTFIVDSKTRFVHAPLEWNSIEERVLWTHVNLGVDEIAVNVRTSLHDAYHHGQDKFDDLHRRLKKACAIASVPFPTVSFRDLHNLFEAKRFEGTVFTTSNCQYYAARTKKDFGNHIDHLLLDKPKVLCFQELTLQDLDVIEKKLSKRFSIYSIQHGISSLPHHICVAVRKQLSATLNHDLPKCAIGLTINTTKFAFCHLPHRWSDSERLHEIQKIKKLGYSILLGDLYVAQIPKIVGFAKYTASNTYRSQSPDALLLADNATFSVLSLSAFTPLRADSTPLSDHKAVSFVLNGF